MLSTLKFLILLFIVINITIVQSLTLTRFSYDANLGYLNLTFSTAINITSFTLIGLNAQSSKDYTTINGAQIVSLQSQSYYIFPSLSTPPNTKNITVVLSTSNLENIALMSNLWRIRGSTYLSANNPFVTDTLGQNILLTGLLTESAMQATTYIVDTTPPTLKYWNLDFNLGIINIYFSKVVSTNTLNISTIAYHNYDPFTGIGPSTSVPTPITNTTASVYRMTTLNSYTYISSITTGYSSLLQINASTLLLNILKEIPGFGRELNGTFLSIDSGAVSDTCFTPNIYNNIYSKYTHPLRVSSIVYDTTPPTIAALTLGM